MSLSLLGARWTSAQADPDRIAALRAAGHSAEVAALLAARLPADASADAWLQPSLEQFHDPFAMQQMDEAVALIGKTVRDRRRIRIVTDYDVDGTTSSLILQAAVRLCEPSATVDYHIPHRFDEGYGFSRIAADRAVADGIGLVVTADIGVRDHDSVAAARTGGCDVLVCDHHLPPGQSVPSDAVVLCPPRAGDTYPNRALAACGVSLKLAEALLSRHPRWPEVRDSLLKLAAIGTVADMVSLATPENRAIVVFGLQSLNRDDHRSPGLRALLRAAGLSPGQIQVSDLGYRIGPRINAAGRIDSARRVVDLFHTRDPVEADALASQIEALNVERRDIQGRLQDEALRAVGDAPEPFVVVAGAEDDGWHRGVVGIVASKLKDVLHRPVAVVSVQGERAVGSVRSTPEVHAVEALESCADLLVKFGGHPAAAGFTVPTAHLDALRSRLSDFVRAAQGAAPPAPARRVDAEVGADRLRWEWLDGIARVGPFGMGNPEPAFLLRGVQVRRLERRLTQAGKPYLRFAVPQAGGGELTAFWWDAPEVEAALRGGPVDLLVRPERDTFRGQRAVKLSVLDARPAEP
jgi:single-stranded-DNA-specific exonuclease